MKQRPVPSISASDPSKFQFNISPVVSAGFFCLFFMARILFPCKFHHYVVQQLVVCQWACWIYYHVAEYLVVDVAVQQFQQFRAAESRVCLQEHQGHFPFRSEERLESQLGLILFLTRPKLSAISRRGINFFILPNSLF